MQSHFILQSNLFNNYCQGALLIEQGIEQGIEKGEIIDKQNVLIKLISRKFGVSDSEKIIIRETDSPEILDAALDIILFAKSKSEVISALEKT